jgi:rod shape-determining protein MreD
MSIFRRLLAAPVLLAVAVVLQVTLVNRLPLPGDAGPDLTLLVVLALAVTGGPVPGMLAGFLGGLALDIAPPGSGLTGENALVFCLVGYGCGAIAGRLRGEDQGLPPPLTTLPLVAVGAAAAEGLLAGLGRMVSDPSTTVPAIERVLPAAIVYDVLLSPFIVLLVAVVGGAPEPGSKAAVLPSQSALARKAPMGVNGAMPGATPRLSFASGKIAAPRPPARPEPRLRLTSGSPSHLPKTTPPAPPHVKFGGSGRDGAIGGSVVGKAATSALLRARSPRIDFSGALGPSLYAGTSSRRPGGAGPGKNWLRTAPAPAPPRRAAVPGRRWLSTGETASPVRSLAKKSPGKGWLRVSGPTAAKPRATGPGKGWLRPAAPVAPAQRKSPGRGWLSHKPARLPLRRKSPRRGWLGGRAFGAGLNRGLGSGHAPGKVRIGGRR